LRNLGPGTIGVCSTLLGALLLLAAPAAAQTPDGQTPAEETVCDGMMGAAWGLCNAYCEAMDCDLYYVLGDAPVPSASMEACLRVHANFEKVSGLLCPPCLELVRPDLCGGGPDCLGQGAVCDPGNDQCCEGLVCTQTILGASCQPPAGN
jgi:hypothetical protein